MTWLLVVLLLIAVAPLAWQVACDDEVEVERLKDRLLPRRQR